MRRGSGEEEGKDENSVKILKEPKDGKIYPKHLPKRILQNLTQGSETMAPCDGKRTEKKEGEGKIIFSRVEDIPTLPASPKRTSEKKFETNTFTTSEFSSKDHLGGPKLSFEINAPKKAIATKQISTFAELSKKLVSRRKLKRNGVKTTFSDAVAEKKLPPLEEHIQEMKADDLLDVVDAELEQSYRQQQLKRESRSKSKSNSRSRSRTRSRSRSKSSSRSSFRSSSRSYSSRSRSYSSRSRSGSSSSSRSRSRSRPRSRSPSILRRKGSPSFLDRRRITSARKRPVPYHRPSPSPTPSWSSRSSSSSSSRSSRSWSRD